MPARFKNKGALTKPHGTYCAGATAAIGTAATATAAGGGGAIADTSTATRHGVLVFASLCSIACCERRAIACSAATFEQEG